MQYELWLKTGETNELLVGSVVVSVTNATSVTITGAGEGRYKVELIGFILQDSFSSFDLIDSNGEIFYTGSFTTPEFEFNSALPLAQIYLYFTAGSMPVGSEFKLYKLDSEGAWTLLDLGDDSPAMNFQVNDLANIQDKKASYSQQLTLPITDRNSAAFGFPDQMDVVNRIPYEAKPCALYCDGVEIVSDEFRLELRQVNHISKTFSCQIVSNTLDFAQRLTNTLFSATPLAPIDWTLQDMEEVKNAPTWYTYLVSSSVKGSSVPLGQANNRMYLAGERPYYSSANTNILFLSNIRPWINLKHVFDTILAQHGYTLETDIEEFPELMNLTDIQSQSDSFTRFNKTITSNSFSGGTAPLYPFQNFPSNPGTELGEVSQGIYLDPNISDEDLPEKTYGIIYASPGFLNVKFNFNCSSTGGTFRIRISRLDNTVSQNAPVVTGDFQWSTFDKFGSVILQEDVSGGASMYTSELISLGLGERIYIEVIATDTSPSPRTVSVQIQVNPEDNPTCWAGCKIYPALSTNFNTQADFVKAFLQVYGLTISIKGNVVKAYTMQEVIDRRMMYIDWSDKIDKGSEIETSYRLSGYAQRNRIKFGQNDDSLDGTFEDAGDIIIDDATLSDLKDLMTLPFTSSRDIPISGAVRVGQNDPAAMEAYQYENDETIQMWGETYSSLTSNSFDFRHIRIPSTRYSTPKHYLAIPGNYSGIHHLCSYTALKRAGSYNPQLAKSATPQYLINEYYDGLQQMVKNIKQVTAYFDLNPLDILALDLLTPVYLDQYGHTFYTQKIENYQDGKLTKVSLVRVVPTTDRETPDPIFIDYTLQGRIQDTSGNPILQEGLRVTCVVKTSGGNYTVVTTTDSGGNFEVSLGQNLESNTELTVSCITPTGYSITENSIFEGMIQGELTYVTLIFQKETQDTYLVVTTRNRVTDEIIPQIQIVIGVGDNPTLITRTDDNGRAWRFEYDIPIGSLLFSTTTASQEPGYNPTVMVRTYTVRGVTSYELTLYLDPEDEPEPVFYKLWGYVYDSETNLPIPGALITMERDQLETGSTFTDNTGYYEFVYTNVDRGARFTANISADNYDPLNHVLIATIVGIEAGEEQWDHYLTPIPVEIPHVVIQGTVTNAETGNPINNAQVQVNPQNHTGVLVTTDANGKYGQRFENVTVNEGLTVTASAQDYNFGRLTDAFTAAEVASQLAIRDFALEPVEILTPVTVYGYIYDKHTGETRPNFQVEVSVQVGITGNNFRQRVLVYTDSNGYYEALVYGSIPDGDLIWSRTVQDGYGSSQLGISINLIETDPKKWQADHTVIELGFDQGFVNFQTFFINYRTQQPIRVRFSDQNLGGGFYRNGNRVWGFSLAPSSVNGVSNCTTNVAVDDQWRMALELNSQTLTGYRVVTTQLQGVVTEQMIWESAQGADFQAGNWMLEKRYYAASVQIVAVNPITGTEQLVSNASYIFQARKNGNVTGTNSGLTDAFGFIGHIDNTGYIPYIRMSNLERSDSVSWTILVTNNSFGTTTPEIVGGTQVIDITNAMLDNEDLGNLVLRFDRKL